MEKRRAFRVALIIALCAATAVPCSWDDTPAFAFRVRPDDPIESYVNGRIGILGREFARSHLVVAYRWLSGSPPSDVERQGFLDLLQHRLKEVIPENREKGWQQARAEIRGVQAGSGIYTTRNAGNYAYFENCTGDAFLKASEVLRDRALRFGAKSPAVAGWLDAQDAVFANCSEGEVLPKPADDSLPALLKADRAYQIASANFYATRYDDARAQFMTIASDAGSPWRQTARFVAARALLRKATVFAKSEDAASYVFDKEPMEQAEKDLRAILADASMAPFHDAARALLNFAVFRLRPEERLKETATALARGTSTTARDARSNLADYTLLLDTLEGEHEDDLTGWIETFQAGGDATAKWRETKKLHWLVAAIASAPVADANELLDASGKIDAASPAYPMIAYHRARLLLAANKSDAARSEIDRALALGEDRLPPSSRNLLIEQRRGIARTLADYLRDAQVKPVGNDSEQTPDSSLKAVLPPDAADVIDEVMPLEMLAEAAQKELQEEIRNPILIAAWTRAILLDRDDVAKKLAPLVIALDPNLEKPFAAWLKASGSQRRFAAADLIVHFGGLQPNVQWYGGRPANDHDLASVNHGGGNWWCIRKSEVDRVTPPFLADPTLVSTAADERLALLELGAGATWMLRAFIDLAEAQPKDPRVAEGLSLAVKGTRWSCGDGETDRLAEEAFNILHKRYAATTWAKETPYWYRSGF
jgi:hypothetical protein